MQQNNVHKDMQCTYITQDNRCDSDPPCQGDHSHDSGLVEGFVSQLRQRKLQEGCEEVSKSSRELWSELRAEVSQQSGQIGEQFLGNKVVHYLDIIFSKIFC